MKLLIDSIEIWVHVALLSGLLKPSPLLAEPSPFPLNEEQILCLLDTKPKENLSLARVEAVIHGAVLHGADIHGAVVYSAVMNERFYTEGFKTEQPYRRHHRADRAFGAPSSGGAECL